MAGSEATGWRLPIAIGTATGKIKCLWPVADIISLWLSWVRPVFSQPVFLLPVFLLQQV